MEIRREKGGRIEVGVERACEGGETGEKYWDFYFIYIFFKT